MMDILSNIAWPAVAWAALSAATVVAAPVLLALADRRQRRRRFYEGKALD